MKWKKLTHQLKKLEVIFNNSKGDMSLYEPMIHVLYAMNMLWPGHSTYLFVHIGRYSIVKMHLIIFYSSIDMETPNGK